MIVHSAQRSFATVLAARAAEQPHATAFVFREGDGEAALTYGELHRRALGVAALVGHGERVVVLYPPGLDYVAALFGCLLAGAVAVPAYPPVRGADAARLRAVVADAEPHVLLTAPGFGAQACDGLATAARLVECDPATAAPSGADVTGPQPGDLALLQYTSGSTAEPRGVLLTHANLLANSAVIRRAFGHTRASRGVIWLPPYHDMGLIGGVLQPVFAGFPCVLMSPLAFIRRPLGWLRAISDHGATTSGGPDFAYALCARRARPQDLAGLDLSSWEVAFIGAEPVRADTLAAFTAAFASCGLRPEALYPCYGLAEATLMVTGSERAVPPLVRTRGGPRPLVGCGRPDADHRLLIVDPDTRVPLPDGEVGEIWLSGSSVATGYRRGGEDTFGAVPARGGGRYLRTGDLGFLEAGELFVTGRIRELIVIAGRNHHPLDIELACEAASPVLRPGCGAALAIERDGAERVAVVFEVSGGDDAETIIAIRRAVATASGAQAGAVALLARGSIPRTSSGKVQRGRCRRLLSAAAEGVLAYWELPSSQRPPPEIVFVQ